MPTPLSTNGIGCVFSYIAAIIITGVFAFAAMTPPTTEIMVTPTPNTSLLPADYGLPDSIAGYTVLMVQTSETTACIPPGVVQLTLQATAPDVDSFLASVNPNDVLDALNRIDPNTHWTTEFVGPGSATIEEMSANIARWNALEAEHGCDRLGPIFTPAPQ